jgi:thioredoxin-related protein
MLSRTFVFGCPLRGLAGLAILCIVTSVASAEPNWLRTNAAALESAKETGKPIVAYVSTPWCHYCKVMAAGTWPDQELTRMMNDRFTPLALDGDVDVAAVEALKVTGFPATILFTKDGVEIARRPGHLTAQEMKFWIQSALPTQTPVNSLRTAQR